MGRASCVAEDTAVGILPHMVRVPVSARSLRLRFHGCEVDYIERVCHASCCESGGKGIGPTIAPSEVAAIVARGATVEAGRLTSRNSCGKCYFKTGNDLCGLHFTPDKPFVCATGPFHLNAHGKLILRNRYKLLRCYRDGQGHPGNVAPPAYRAFGGSLAILLGDEQYEKLVAHLDGGGGDTFVTLDVATYDLLCETALTPVQPQRVEAPETGLMGESI